VPYKGYFERFKDCRDVRVTGKVLLYRGKIEFHHPDIHVENPEEEVTDQIIPLYSETEGLKANKLSKLIDSAIDQVIDHPVAPPQTEYSHLPRAQAWRKQQILGVPDPLPEWIKQKYALISRADALKEIHKPPADKGDEYLNFKSPAQKRIAFDEFFWMELHLAATKMNVQREKGVPLETPPQRLEEFYQKLPFKLTGAQHRAIKDIFVDLKKSHPMHRLVQGDVGSGKTLVALAASVLVADNQMQSCIMVPTEILAEQHYLNAKKFLEPLGIRVALLTGSTKAAEKSAVNTALRAGKIDLIVGTHALIQEAVEFESLAFVIIDEQHRFGVEQRNKLKAKGMSPHFLVMTATPIPRTLAMTVYGDLDVSVIDELPPGRTPIVTRKVFENKRSKVIGFMQEQVAKGRQAYIVYPLVEESEKIDLKNAMDEYEKLKEQFPKIRFGLLHGKMKPDDKDKVMKSFRDHQYDVLVATTVIEVGVDVANANMMIIEHAERFGLSQLHQLRGRVGRGQHKSYCVLLLSYASGEDSRERAEIMERYTDGFKIAEADLEIRGPGEFLGRRQSGLPGFKLANLVRDVEILQQARDAAFELIQKDPQLKLPEHQALKTYFEAQKAQLTG